MPQILLVEDDSSMRAYIKRALTDVGYTVTDYGDSEAALAPLESGVYDLLLTDIIMPGIDGIELAHIAGKVAPNTKIMFITGFAAVSMRAQEDMPGATILSKPFHLNQLVKEVDSLFAKKPKR